MSVFLIISHCSLSNAEQKGISLPKRTSEPVQLCRVRRCSKTDASSISRARWLRTRRGLWLVLSLTSLPQSFIAASSTPHLHTVPIPLHSSIHILAMSPYKQSSGASSSKRVLNDSDKTDDTDDFDWQKKCLEFWRSLGESNIPGPSVRLLSARPPSGSSKASVYSRVPSGMRTKPPPSPTRVCTQTTRTTTTTPSTIVCCLMFPGEASKT